jgi:hypothetical protein
MKDYQYFEEFLENSKYSICNEGFTETNKPTLDHKYNKLGHTRDNVVPCCCYCNCVKSNKDERYTKLFIQLTKICNENALTIHTS